MAANSKLTTSRMAGSSPSQHLTDSVSSKRTFGLFSLVFFSYGFVNMLNHDNVLVGVEDILENTTYSTGWISLTLNLFFLSTTIGLHHFHGNIKTVHKMWFSCITMIIGSTGVGFFPLIPLKIASVCLTGIGSACLQSTIMFISPKYPDDLLYKHIIGASCGRIASPFIYAVGVTYLCIKPRLFFLIISLSSFVFPLYFHLLLDKNPDQSGIDQESTDVLLPPEGDEDQSKGRREPIQNEKIPWRIQLSLFYGSFFRFYADFLSYFFMTLALQCLFTTLAFKDSRFKPREYYQYYLLAAWSGMFVGTNLWYISKYCGKMVESFSLKADIKACILVAISVSNFAVLFQAVWYRNLQNVWVVLVLAFIVGFLPGSTTVLSNFYLVSEKESHIAYIRTALLVVQAAGCVIPSGIAILLEPMVSQRCFEVEHTRQYCIARYIGIGNKPCYSTR